MTVPTPPRIGYHATTFRASHHIWDGGEGLDPAMSERFEHVFLFESMTLTLDFIRRYPDNFPTGAVIFELDLTGLELEPDPQNPPLPGAWRCVEIIGLDRLRAQYDGAGQVTWMAR